MPKVSVITINFNNRAGFEKTIRSVFSQSYSDFEFVVIDGGSTDGSVDVINANAGKITYWISEKDAGIYDALNKGIVNAKGDYLIFLNSGDCFNNDNVVAKFCECSNKNNKKIIYANSNILNADGTSKVVCPPDQLDLNFWYANTLNHQAIFTHKDLFKNYGGFDCQYELAADFDFLFKMFLNETSEFFYFDYLVCDYDNTGLTSKGEFHKIIFKERKKILKKYVSLKNYRGMRRNYFKTISIKKKYSIIISENNFLRIALKPIYKVYKFFIK
jgi:glycosyltransferase involved in cell wall biosynthesis